MKAYFDYHDFMDLVECSAFLFISSLDSMLLVVRRELLAVAVGHHLQRLDIRRAQAHLLGAARFDGAELRVAELESARQSKGQRTREWTIGWFRCRIYWP